MSNTLPYNSSLAGLPIYQPGRPIEEVARELGVPPSTVIKLASNENPLGPSPLALAAMRSALDQVHLYPDGSAFLLKRKLAEHFGLDTSNLTLGNGSNEIIEFIGHALMGPGTEVIVSQYCFAIYPIVARMFGAAVVTVPAIDYGHDIGAMIEAVTPATRALFVANPNNPTGTIAPRDDMVRLLNEVPPSVLLVIDEAYFEFLNDPVDFLPLIRSGARENLILLRTFSKIYGLAGLRLGYGIGHPDLIQTLERVRQPFNINSIAQAGALAAIEDTTHLENTRLNNFEGLHFFENALRRARIDFVPSFANFLLIKVGEGRRVFLELQKQGIITRPMDGYQLPEWIRVSVGSRAENQRCLDALLALKLS